MKTISKKLLSLLLVVIMVASVIPFQAFAELVNNDTCPDSACTGHVTAYAAKAATCTEDGNVEYFLCNVCNRKFNAGGVEINPVEAAHHVDGVAVAEVPATCSETGTKAYITCANCTARKVDGVWTKDSKKWTLSVSATAHVSGTYVDEVPPTCSEAGTKAYTPCTKCSARLVAGIGWTTNSADWTIPASATGHVDGTPVAEVPATCTEAGTKAYTPCTKCSARWVPDIGWTTDSADWTIPAAGHKFSTTVEGGTDDDCYKVKCKTCKKYFACDDSGCVTNPTPLTDGHAPHTVVDGICSVCGNGMPAGENVATEFKVLVKYVNAANQEIKAEEVHPTCVIMKADDKYIETAVMSTGFYMPAADPTAELRFSVQDFFTADHYDDDGMKMLLNQGDKIVAVKRNQRNEVTIKVKYDPTAVVTVKFYHGDGGKFTGTNKNKNMISFDVPYGSALPTPPAYEGKDAAHRAVAKWSTDPSGYPVYPYNAGGASKLSSDLTLYAVYDTTAQTEATLNIVFYGTDVTTVTKTMTGLDASETLGTYLKKAKLKDIIDYYGFGFELVSDRLYKNAYGAVYEANTTVADVNQSNGYVYINVKPTTFNATFYGSDGVVDGLIANSDYKTLTDLKYGQTKIEMPIPVATESGHTFYGWRERGGEIYKFEPNTKLTFTYNYNRDTFFEPIWNTSAGVFVNIYFNNITNRSLYTVEIHDVQDTLTVNQVLSLLSRYFTWTDYRGLYTNAEWITAVKNNFATGAGTKSVDGMSVVLDKDRNEFNLMLLGAKQNGITITNANLSTIGIGVNANGAYAPADPTNPKTGNETEMLGVAMASMVMAVITLAGVTYYTRKKEEMI